MWRSQVYLLLLVKWACISRPEPAWLKVPARRPRQGSTFCWQRLGLSRAPPPAPPAHLPASLPRASPRAGVSLQISVLTPRPLQSPHWPPRPQKIEFRLSQTTVTVAVISKYCLDYIFLNISLEIRSHFYNLNLFTSEGNFLLFLYKRKASHKDDLGE